MLKVTLQVHSVCFIRNKTGIEYLTLIILDTKPEKKTREQSPFFPFIFRISHAMVDEKNWM